MVSMLIGVISQQFCCYTSVIICIKYAQLHFRFEKKRTVQIQSFLPALTGDVPGWSDSWQSNFLLINSIEYCDGGVRNSLQGLVCETLV